MATGHHIFVSYSDKNRRKVDALVGELEARNIRVWIAPRDVRPNNYLKDTEQAIEDCAAFVVVITVEANESNFVHSETAMAFAMHKPIFPVRLEPTKPAKGLTLVLSVRHWTDAFGPERSRNLDRLVEELGTATAQASTAHPRPPQVNRSRTTRPGAWIGLLLAAGLVAIAVLMLRSGTTPSRFASQPASPNANANQGGTAESADAGSTNAPEPVTGLPTGPSPTAPESALLLVQGSWHRLGGEGQGCDPPDLRISLESDGTLMHRYPNAAGPIPNCVINSDRYRVTAVGVTPCGGAGAMQQQASFFYRVSPDSQTLYTQGEEFNGHITGRPYDETTVPIYTYRRCN